MVLSISCRFESAQMGAGRVSSRAAVGFVRPDHATKTDCLAGSTQQRAQLRGRLACGRVSRQVSRISAQAPGGGPAASPEQQEEEEGGDSLDPGFVRALLLAWFAAQQRSLFAAKCLVETVIELYQAGYNLDDVKLALSLVGLEYGGKLLGPLNEDILLSWVALVMMALKTVGVEPRPEGRRRLEAKSGGELTESTSRMTLGLQMFAKQCVDLYLGGTDLYRLQLQQSMGGQSGGMEGEDAAARGPSPAVQVMQQNTRLVIITMEVVRAMGLPTDFPLRPGPPPESAAEDSGSGSASEEPEAAAAASASASVSSPGDEGQGAGAPAPAPSSRHPLFGRVGFVPSFLRYPGAAPGTAPGSVGAYATSASATASSSPGSSPASSSSSSSSAGGGSVGGGVSEQKRSAAVRLLIGFVGAASGWLYPAWDFIDTAADCYQLGWTADELFTQLKDEEFAQSGGVFPVGVAGMGSPERISATLFANWLSVIYMTLAQLGVPHPGAAEKQGWAWVCSLQQDESSGPAALQAQGISDFVSNTLRLEAQREAGQQPAAVAAESPSAAAVAAAAPAAAEAAAARRRPREGFVVVEDPELARTSGFALLISQQISLVQMTRQRVLAAAAAAAQVAA